MAKKYDPAGLLIGAGVLIGLGIGFLVNNIPAGLFIGLGCGLAAAAIVAIKAK